MNIKIAVIATEFLRDFVHSSLGSLNLPFEYEIYPYRAFTELSNIYLSLPDDVSGIVASGFFPCEILRRNFPDSQRIIRAFNNDDADLYKLFLHLLQSNRSLSPDRIHADLLGVVGLDVTSYLSRPLSVSFDSLLSSQAGKQSLADLLKMEERATQEHLSLWQQGLIDVSITRFSGIVRQLREAGLPVHFIYPNRPYLESVFKSVVQGIRFRLLHDNQAAAVLLSFDAKNCTPESASTRMSELQRALALFCSLTPMHISARRTERGIEMLINRKSLDILTDGFKACKLQAFLRQHLNFAVHIGYGLGETVHQARLNAMDSNREAGLSPAGASCLINENDELIAPLNQDKKIVISRSVSPSVNALAKRTGLSSLTLQKIEAALGTSEFRRTTSDELADKLSITKRSANRILSALKDSGAAHIVSLQRGTTRGRPERVYQIAPM